MEAALAQDEEYQFKVEQANFRKNQYLAEEVERSAKRRRETSECSEEHVIGPDEQELPEGGAQDDTEMTMENHETKETSSSRESGQRSAERRESSMQGRVKRKADDELLEEREEASRTRSTEGGDELPIPEASSSVGMGGSRQSTQLKRPQGDEPAQEDQPQARRARLEILCSFVHGYLDQGEDMHQEAKEIKQLIQAANGSLSLNILEEAASVEADPDATEWDNYWTPWWQKKGAEQVPPELTAHQVLSAKKVEMRNIEERGVYEVVKREVMEQTPGATMLSVKWVLTNKGTPKAPVPKARLVAREFVSNALDRDTLFSGTPGLAIARSLISKAATCRSPKGKLKIMLLDVTAAILYGDCERSLFMELPQEDPRSSNPNLVARLIKSLYGTRDAPQLWARHVEKTLRGLGYAKTKGAPGVYYHK